MVPQDIKDIYFLATRFLSLPILVFTKWRYQKQPEELYLHLGCGANYIPGMLNIDGNIRCKKDLWIDLRNGLPFPDESVYFIYSSHMLEHFYPDQAIALLREMCRTLKYEGIVRIAVPSVEHALKIALGETSYTWPRCFEDSLSQLVDYLFCDGQHKYAYTYEIMKNFALQAGFRTVLNYSEMNGTRSKVYVKYRSW